MPHEELTPRSDSISTESSNSPPDPPGSNHSETSSGVHSNASSEHQNLPPPIVDNSQGVDCNLNRRATSVADLAQPREDQWKSFSLQRNVQPPTNYPTPHHTKNHSIGGYNVSQNSPIYGYKTNVSSPNQKNTPTYYTQNSFGQTVQNGTPVYSSQNIQATPYSQNSQNQPTYGYTTFSQIKTQTVVYGTVSSPQNVQPQPTYGYTSGSQNVQTTVAQPTYIYTSTPQNVQTSIPQPVYGYTSSPQTVQQTQPLYGYTSSPQNVQTQNYGPTSGSQTQTSVPQPVYGYTTSPQNVQTNVTQPTYGYTSNTSNVQTSTPQPVYGYTSSPQNVQTSVAQPTYGYTQSQGGSQTVPATGSPQTNQNQYGFNSNNSLTGSTFSVEKSGGIPVILENSENTVVIRRKNTNSVVCENTQNKEEPFGRSTNMRMTSFTEHLPPDLKNIQASSATLPHYPTQPNQNPQQQYSTMPLPMQQKTTPTAQVNLGAGTSCNVYSRQHSTIPTHHNGVRLFPANQNPYVKRYNGVRVNGEGLYSGGRKEENYYSS